jgi:hypothetical protein
VLREAREQNWIERIPARSPGFGFQLLIVTTTDSRHWVTREGWAFNPAANALAQSVDHILSFFRMLRSELP